MSLVKNNVLTKGLSGKLGNQVVFRQWKGATFLAKVPVRSSSSVKNEVQLKNIQRFKEAIAYAKNAMNDAELKQAYKSKCKKRQTAYVRAIQDFYSIPVIRDIDLSNYTGDAGSFIRVKASDDFRVRKVQVRIEDNQSQIVESGIAVQEGDSDWWKFVVTAPNLFPERGKVTATVFDVPGNEMTVETVI